MNVLILKQIKSDKQNQTKIEWLDCVTNNFKTGNPLGRNELETTKHKANYLTALKPQIEQPATMQ